MPPNLDDARRQLAEAQEYVEYWSEQWSKAARSADVAFKSHVADALIPRLQAQLAAAREREAALARERDEAVALYEVGWKSGYQSGAHPRRVPDCELDLARDNEKLRAALSKVASCMPDPIWIYEGPDRETCWADTEPDEHYDAEEFSFAEALAAHAHIKAVEVDNADLARDNERLRAMLERCAGSICNGVPSNEAKWQLYDDIHALLNPSDTYRAVRQRESR